MYTWSNSGWAVVDTECTLVDWTYWLLDGNSVCCIGIGVILEASRTCWSIYWVGCSGYWMQFSLEQAWSSVGVSGDMLEQHGWAVGIMEAKQFTALVLSSARDVGMY
jgi:hypothetical protein